MDLVNGREFCARKDGVDRAAPVLGDRLALVAAAGADVEAREDAGGHPAAATDEAVRHRRKPLGADHLYAHRAFRMIKSSSA
jgi:hypothetical protein